jgi:RNA polymerase sigma-70 factor (ECF subfamily)
LTEKELVQRCIKGNREAQRELFDKYSGRLHTVCRRYARDEPEAEDFLQEGLIVIYKKLNTFKFKGSLMGWMRTVVVNVSLRQLQKRKKNLAQDIDQINEPGFEQDMLAALTQEEILKEIQKLPEGYRIVFNLYVIEGYKHNEIAKMLEIGESTSRSQLTKARRLLQKSLMHLQSIFI